MNYNSQLLLTGRECEVMERFILGDRNKEIAASLEISPGTVETHLRNVTHKFRARSRAHLSVLYVKWRTQRRSARISGLI